MFYNQEVCLFILLVVQLQDVMAWVMSVENMLDTEGNIK